MDAAPNKKVLTVDAYVRSYDPTGMNFELYNPASGKWTSPGEGTRVQLWDSAADCGGRPFASFEVGPAVLRPDGTRLLHWSERLRRGPHCDLQLEYRSLDAWP